MAAAWTRQKWLDAIAIGISSLCLVHCILLPIILIALPILSASVFLSASLHFWGLIVAAPVSALAIWIGYTRHREVRPAILAAAGLGGLIAAEGIHGSAVEPWLAISGALLIAMAHGLNLRATNKRGAGHSGKKPA